MTTSGIDGRPWIERAREVARWDAYTLHENPSQAMDVIGAMLPVVEAALKYADEGDRAAFIAALEKFETVERKDYR